MGDNKGNFEVAGLAMEGRATRRLRGVQEVEAYILDSHSGDIVYAPDLGNYGAKLLPNQILSTPADVVVVLLHSLAYLQLSMISWISGIYARFGNLKSTTHSPTAHQRSMDVETVAARRRLRSRTDCPRL